MANTFFSVFGALWIFVGIHSANLFYSTDIVIIQCKLSYTLPENLNEYPADN